MEKTSFREREWPGNAWLGPHDMMSVLVAIFSQVFLIHFHYLNLEICSINLAASALMHFLKNARCSI